MIQEASWRAFAFWKSQTRVGTVLNHREKPAVCQNKALDDIPNHVFFILRGAFEVHWVLAHWSFCRHTLDGNSCIVRGNRSSDVHACANARLYNILKAYSPSS